jgi:hypothetical protein
MRDMNKLGRSGTARIGQVHIPRFGAAASSCEYC